VERRALIVETEAYGGATIRRHTPFVSNEAQRIMFGPAGFSTSI